MSAPSVLHVLPALNRGGATRALLAALEALDQVGSAPLRSVVSLREPDPSMRERLEDLQISLIETPAPERLKAEIERADIVQLEFWNTPEAYELLRAELPACRLLLRFVIGGGTAPQVILPELLEVADLALAQGPVIVDGSDLEPEVILPVIDPSRLAVSDPAPRDGFVVGYVGTVDPAKMHPDFVELCAAVGTAGARFGVYGSGDGFAAIAAEADRLGVRERFELGGYVEDVGTVLAGFDVFGYPLCRGNYSSTDLALLEAMLAGVPPVVLPYGGAGRVVVDGETGLVAPDERAYPAAIERLGGDPELRARLGEGARRHVASTYSSRAGAERWSAAYERLLERPKRRRSWRGMPAATGAELFLASLGGMAGPLADSYRPAGSEAALVADASVAALPAPLIKADGGILDYRRRFTSDPHLRLWSGLVLSRMGRPALAAGEFAAAGRLGIDRERLAGLAVAG